LDTFEKSVENFKHNDLLNMEQRLVQKQAQKLLFTPKMQESMHILQISMVELKALIENELQTNPLLEETNHEASPLNVNRKIEDNDIRRDMRVTKPVTLEENLLGQLGLSVGSQEDMEIGREIIGNIDDDGYLKATCEEIALALKKDVSRVEAILEIVQSFDPAGVGARDLKECLLIQLCAKGKKDSLAWKIVEDHLTSCGKKQYDKMAKAMGVTLDQVKSGVAEISKLEPKPGRRYSDNSEAQYIVPDIYLKMIDGEYHIINNKFGLPNMKVNRFYNNVLSDKTSDKETKDYIKEKMRGANFIIKCLEQRWETMQRITEFLLREQVEAIEKGRAFLKPLTFKEAAKAIGRHESTISRAVANKYIDTPSGIFGLKEFFSGKVSNGNGNNGDGNDNGDISSTSVKMELKDIVKKEARKKPLSDQRLRKILTDKGIDISRRTIAKYRDELKILPSHLRKI